MFVSPVSSVSRTVACWDHIRSIRLQRFIDAITNRFRRKKRRRSVPATSAAAFWRTPESVPIKRQMIDARWGKGTVPAVLTFDLTPLRSIGFEETVQLAELFYGKPQYTSGTITYRDSLSVDAPMVYLTIKHPRVFHGEIEIRGYRLPLYRVSHKHPGRSAGTTIEFKDLHPGVLDAPRKTG